MVQPNETANAIIAKALENAGVPPRNIVVPPEVTEVEPIGNLPSLDGLPKGQVKGEELEPVAVATPVPGAEPAIPVPSEPIVPPLSKADIEAAINESSARIQSLMDRKLNQIDYQMKQTIGAFNQFFQSQEDANIAGLPENEQILKRLERVEKGGQQPKIQIQPSVEQQVVPYFQQLVNFVDTVGLKVDDKRLDWAPDTDNAQVGFKRFLASVKTALVEDQTKVIQELKNVGAKEITKLKKITGVDKISVSGPSGQGTSDTSKMTPLQKIDYGFQVQEQLSQANQ